MGMGETGTFRIRLFEKGWTAVLLTAVMVLQTGCGGAKDRGILDLSVMSGNVVYAEVLNIMMSPDEYVGRTIRMSGAFEVEHDLVNNRVYTYCVIQDATACCAKGIEFKWKGDHTYPDDFPAIDGEITVCGVFERYEDETGECYRVADADLEKL